MSARQKHLAILSHVRRIRNAYHGRTHRSAPTGISQHCAETDSAGVDVESAQSSPEMGHLNDKMRRFFSDHPATCRRGGPMCPPVVGIQDSLRIRGIRTVFLWNGHINPPLRDRNPDRILSMGNLLPTQTVIFLAVTTHCGGMGIWKKHTTCL